MLWRQRRSRPATPLFVSIPRCVPVPLLLKHVNCLHHYTTCADCIIKAVSRAPKPRAKRERRAADRNTGSEDVVPEPLSYWSCPVCTLFNGAACTACEACGSARGNEAIRV